MLVEGLKRKFILKEKDVDIELSDVDPNMTVDQIRKFYSGTYPHLLNTGNPAGVFEDGIMVYRFNDVVIGDKG